MWPAYIESTLAFLPNAEEKIVFDKFHVAKYLTHAVDLERRAAERRDPTLKSTRYQWLRRPQNMSRAQRVEFTKLRRTHERAWSRLGDQRDVCDSVGLHVRRRCVQLLPRLV